MVVVGVVRQGVGEEQNLIGTKLLSFRQRGKTPLNELTVNMFTVNLVVDYFEECWLRLCLIRDCLPRIHTHPLVLDYVQNEQGIVQIELPFGLSENVVNHHLVERNIS